MIDCASVLAQVNALRPGQYAVWVVDEYENVFVQVARSSSADFFSCEARSGTAHDPSLRSRGWSGPSSRNPNMSVRVSSCDDAASHLCFALDAFAARFDLACRVGTFT